MESISRKTHSRDGFLNIFSTRENLESWEKGTVFRTEMFLGKVDLVLEHALHGAQRGQEVTGPSKMH